MKSLSSKEASAISTLQRFEVRALTAEETLEVFGGDCMWGGQAYSPGSVIQSGTIGLIQCMATPKPGSQDYWEKFTGIAG